ncbi:hypothetical protein [Longispora urticae]
MEPDWDLHNEYGQRMEVGDPANMLILPEDHCGFVIREVRLPGGDANPGVVVELMGDDDAKGQRLLEVFDPDVFGYQWVDLNKEED